MAGSAREGKSSLEGSGVDRVKEDKGEEAAVEQ